MAAIQSSVAAPLLERAGELGALAGVIEDARAGRGGIALVEGPAGIGKTALLERGLQLGRVDGARVALARGGELERDLPWAVLRDLFERLFTGFSREERNELLSGAGTARSALYGGAERVAPPGGEPLAVALSDLLRLTRAIAEQGPVILAVDDVHWADASSLRFVAYLAARVRDLPVALLISVRSGEPETSGPLLAEIASQPWTTRVRPGPLGQEAAAELLEALLGRPAKELAERCHELAAGNPFYLRELIHDLPQTSDEVRPDAVEELHPRTVAEMLRRRLARLPAGALELARALALLGSRTSVQAAARLAELPFAEATQAADALIAADVLRPELPLEFVHPLVRRVVYSGTPPAERGRQHARAAELLSELGAAPADVATHLLATEPRGDGRTVAALADAARDAAERGAPEVAVAYLRRALDEPAGEDVEPQLTWQLGRAEAAVSGAAALPTLHRALDLATDAADRVEIALELSLILRISSEFPRAAALLEPLLDDLAPGSELAQRVEGELINVALMSGPGGLPIAARHVGRYLALEGRDAVTDPRLLAALATVSVGSNQPVAAALELAERALAGVGRESMDPTVVLYLAYALAYCDRLEAARGLAADLAVQGAENGSAVAQGFALATLSRVHLREGSLRDADLAAGRCMGFYRDWPADPLDPIAFRADALIELGELDAAEAIVTGVDLGEREERWDTLVLRGARGRLRLARGDPAAALDDLLRCGSQLIQAGGLNPALMAWRSSAALAQLALGARGEAIGLAAEELELARKFGAPSPLGVALRCRGLVEGHRAGLELLEESVAVLENSGAKLEYARSLCELGAALRRSGRSRDAHKPLREGLDLAVRCEAAPLAVRAREELIAAGARPRRDHVWGREALTASELRVAKLAGEGATNREIAQRLVVTLRTVETHLTHAYRKLDIATRADIPEALEREQA